MQFQVVTRAKLLHMIQISVNKLAVDLHTPTSNYNKSIVYISTISHNLSDEIVSEILTETVRLKGKITGTDKR